MPARAIATSRWPSCRDGGPSHSTLSGLETTRQFALGLEVATRGSLHAWFRPWCLALLLLTCQPLATSPRGRPYESRHFHLGALLALPLPARGDGRPARSVPDAAAPRADTYEPRGHEPERHQQECSRELEEFHDYFPLLDMIINDVEACAGTSACCAGDGLHQV